MQLLGINLKITNKLKRSFFAQIFSLRFQNYLKKYKLIPNSYSIVFREFLKGWNSNLLNDKSLISQKVGVDVYTTIRDLYGFGLNQPLASVYLSQQSIQTVVVMEVSIGPTALVASAKHISRTCINT